MIPEKVKDQAKQVRKDAPAGIADMFAMAVANDIDLKIVDDPNYRLSEEDIAKGTKVIVFIKGGKDAQGKDRIGHYQLLGSDGISVDIGENDCGYAVFAELTGKSVDTLRHETAENIENCGTFNNSIKAQAWLLERHPQEYNTLACVGGNFQGVGAGDSFNCKKFEINGDKLEIGTQRADPRHAGRELKKHLKMVAETIDAILKQTQAQQRYGSRVQELTELSALFTGLRTHAELREYNVNTGNGQQHSNQQYRIVTQIIT